MKVDWRSDDIVRFCVNFESVDLGDDGVDFPGKNAWGWHYFVRGRGEFFFDEERPRPVVMKLARKILSCPGGEEVNFIPWVERAKGTLIVLPATLYSFVEVSPSEEVRSLFLARSDEEVLITIAAEFALAVVKTAEEEVEAGCGISPEDDLVR